MLGCLQPNHILPSSGLSCNALTSDVCNVDNQLDRLPFLAAGTGAASSASSSELEATTPLLAVALPTVLVALSGFLADFAFVFGWLRSSKSPELQRQRIQHAGK